jgi:hypothetical protein
VTRDNLRASGDNLLARGMPRRRIQGAELERAARARLTSIRSDSSQPERRRIHSIRREISAFSRLLRVFSEKLLPPSGIVGRCFSESIDQGDDAVLRMPFCSLVALRINPPPPHRVCRLPGPGGTLEPRVPRSDAGILRSPCEPLQTNASICWPSARLERSAR